MNYIAYQLLKKMSKVVEKNHGYKKLREKSKILKRESVQNDFNYTAEQLPCLKYAPITSCDVERSFSRYKSVLRDNRIRFSFELLRQHLSIEEFGAKSA